MPVGSSDQGVGLGAGDVMLSADAFYQFIDWRHDQIDDLEPYDHIGTLSTTIISPKITIGLSDWWNVSFQQILGSRHMGWDLSETSKHHRTEESHSDFLNAIGGYLGDGRIMFRYLALNTGRGQGSRLFLGLGYLIPSKNTLTKSPFLKENSEYLDHRHFSMSQGVQKVVLESQYYFKKATNPVFMGMAFKIDEPLLDNKHGFSGSRLLDLTFSIMNNKNNLFKIPYGLNLVISHENETSWNGIPTQNSESTVITPGIGWFWSSNFAILSLNIQYPIFLNVIMSESGDKDLNQEAHALQISLSIRKILDYTIPWLYW